MRPLTGKTAAFNWKFSGVNGVYGERKRRQRHLSGEIAKLMAFNGKKSEVNGAEPEKWRHLRR